MNQVGLHTPVVFIIFNRPETTKKVFAEIRRARPSRLLVIADGPRATRLGEAEKCTAARAVIEGVDWPCEVLTNFSEENMGCKRRISSGLDWVFQQVEEAIILEDDCLPCRSFFPFCEALLERYRDDNRVAMISGDNFLFGRCRTSYSYYFSRYPHIWGWATWRRSWERYDVEMKLWPEVRDGGWLEGLFGRKRSTSWFWRQIFEMAYQGKADTWDYQLTFSTLVSRGLCILPSENLVSNIGFGNDATRTRRVNKFAAMETADLDFPLSHPPFMIRNSRADDLTESEQFSLRSSPHLLVKKMKGLINDML